MYVALEGASFGNCTAHRYSRPSDATVTPSPIGNHAFLVALVVLVHGADAVEAQDAVGPGGVGGGVQRRPARAAQTVHVTTTDLGVLSHKVGVIMHNIVATLLENKAVF